MTPTPPDAGQRSAMERVVDQIEMDDPRQYQKSAFVEGLEMQDLVVLLDAVKDLANERVRVADRDKIIENQRAELRKLQQRVVSDMLHAEIKRLRERLQRAEAVVEAARAMAAYHPRTATDTLLYAALCAYDAAASAAAREHTDGR